jgi:hypothetical protein
MRPMRMAVAGLIGLMLGAPALAGAQDHHHAPDIDADPLLRVILEGPHLVLAHHGFILLTSAELDALRAARGRVCAAEIGYVRDRAAARAALAGRAVETGDVRVQAAVERLARIEADWMLALVRARQETLAVLGPREREQVAWLGAHWAREARAMITSATHAGHRGHPGVQMPIRVPGMVVAETAIVPACEALHGPATHLSIPPPP